MSESNIVSPWGYPTGEPKVNDDLVKCLEDMLERAKAGDVIGMSAALLFSDGMASFRIAGMIGGYSLLGALTAVTKRTYEIIDGNE